jgi:hypothetical protein
MEPSCSGDSHDCMTACPLRLPRSSRGSHPNQLSISRTALYRFEKGELAKTETLERLAELLGVSIPSLLGVGIEYIPSAVTYFERMR